MHDDDEDEYKPDEPDPDLPEKARESQPTQSGGGTFHQELQLLVDAGHKAGRFVA